jgi:hypothetical protein
MTYADGVYTKVYEKVAAGSYKLKVARDHDWGTAYPAEDLAYTVSDADSIVTVTLTGTEVKIEVAVPSTDPIPTPDPTPDPEPATGEYLSYTGNDCYTLSATPDQYVNSIQVTYSAVSDNTYQNINTWIQDKAAGNNGLTVTIKNNGSETVNITVKLDDFICRLNVKVNKRVA